MALWSTIVVMHKRNITIIQHFQNKVLRYIVNAQWYIVIENIATKHNTRLRYRVNSIIPWVSKEVVRLN